jgi:ATP-binding cassette subfamily B protein
MMSDATESDYAALRRLVTDQGIRQWRRYVAAFICMAVVASTTALSAWLIKDIVNQIFVERKLSALWAIVAAIVIIYSSKGLAVYYQATIMANISNSIVANVQRRIFDHLLKMEVRYFNDSHSTMFITRQAFITRSAASALNLIVTAIGRDSLTLIGLVIVMVIQDPLMSVAALVILPGAILSVRSLSRRIKKIIAREFEGFAIMLENIAEASQGIRMVKAFRLEGYFKEAQNDAIASFERASNKMAMVGARTSPIMETLGGFLIAMVVFYGGWRVIVGGATPGEFFSFITALLLAYEPAKRLARAHVDLTASLVGVKMLYDFLSRPAGEAEPEGLPPLVVTKGAVAFNDVWFGYNEKTPILRGLSFEARPGETIALVGRSGAGKSTVFNLLLRYWEPWEGKILIDGVEVSSTSRGSLRDAIAYVGQDAFLFKGTIKQNIAMGLVGATDLEIEEAARAAYAHEFILGLDLGYDTPCGEHGINLSGGQRQRIAIARAFLKNAPILLLDEATSALDGESEGFVQDALRSLCAGRTTIIIAHRLQTIQSAHEIYVIDDGKVVDRGTHERLMSSSRVYASMNHFVEAK